MPAYPVDPGSSEGQPDTQPETFRRSKLSYVTLAFLLIVWPALSVGFVGDPSETLKQLSASPILLIYVPTIVTQWLLFLLVYLTTIREKTGLKGIGFRRIRGIDLLWAAAFLLVSNLVLAGVSVVLDWVGLKIPGELGLILPKTSTERVLWVILSLTAGVCEETAFRGYLLTRLRIFTGSKSWVLPLIVASLAFGTGHTYQGIGGFILISIYGLMFGLLYIRTGSLWPPIIAHFFQDFSALFYPYPG
jgi:membrane protease YdiL (CAAX protease family)